MKCSYIASCAADFNDLLDPNKNGHITSYVIGGLTNSKIYTDPDGL